MGLAMSLKKEDAKKMPTGDTTVGGPKAPPHPDKPEVTGTTPQEGRSKQAAGQSADGKGGKGKKGAGGKDKKKVDVPEPANNEEARKMLKTTLYDPRFPNTNQTRNCYQNYLDYHRCLKVKNDEGYCHYYKWAYNELCPGFWTDKWDAQREMGIFPGRI